MKHLLLSLIIISFSACSLKWDVQKRRYNKGFHWSVAHKNHSPIEKMAKQTRPNRETDVAPTVIRPAAENISIDNQIVLPFPTADAKTKQANKKAPVVFFTNHKQSAKVNVLKKELKMLMPDKDKSVPGTALFVLVCVLAGLFTVAGIGYVMLFLSTSATAYLLYALAAALLAGLFFAIMQNMNKVE